MTEYDEFAEALIDQLLVEINEEKENSDLASKIDEDSSFNVTFDSLEDASNEIFPWVKQKIVNFTGLAVPENTKLEFPELLELKKLKGKRIFTTDNAREFVDSLVDAISKGDKGKIASLMKQDQVKYLVYSTYVKNYISKISVTFGDYLDDTIYLNKLFFSILPKIKLYSQGEPYESWPSRPPAGSAIPPRRRACPCCSAVSRTTAARRRPTPCLPAVLPSTPAAAIVHPPPPTSAAFSAPLTATAMALLPVTSVRMRPIRPRPI